MQKGAKYRAYTYLFQFMNKVKRIKKQLTKHRDAYQIVHLNTVTGRSPTLECIQQCSHCQCDPRELWAPEEDHSYANCLRRAEVQHGTHFVQELHLCANGICYAVCPDFFKKTFGLTTNEMGISTPHSA